MFIRQYIATSYLCIVTVLLQANQWHLQFKNS